MYYFFYFQKTKIIIGCFVGITIFCALLLIVFYKVRSSYDDLTWPHKAHYVVSVDFAAYTLVASSDISTCAISYGP